ncbi:MAG: hypothetical protein ACRD6X_00805 [Pyrinomonadaceae bacterium]
MSKDVKRQLLRHMLATVGFRCRIAIADAPADFALFRVSESARTPGEILAHLGDLIHGSHFLLKGELVYLASEPLPWQEETARFFDGIRKLDSFLATDEPLACPVEKLIQGPIGDALTHIGQIVLLRRVFGSPIREEPYFEADIVPGMF